MIGSGDFGLPGEPRAGAHGLTVPIPPVQAGIYGLLPPFICSPPLRLVRLEFGSAFASVPAKTLDLGALTRTSDGSQGCLLRVSPGLPLLPTLPPAFRVYASGHSLGLPGESAPLRSDFPVTFIRPGEIDGRRLLRKGTGE